MIKPDVQMYGEQPEMIACHIEIKGVFNDLGHICTTTSIVGKQHKAGSLHPVGFARDYRTKHITGNLLTTRLAKLNNLVSRIKEAVPQCDVILEHVGEKQEHIHVEYDPKNDPKFAKAKRQYKQSGVWPGRG